MKPQANHAASIITTEQMERNRRDPAGYRARHIAARLAPIADSLATLSKSYAQDIPNAGAELTAAEALIRSAEAKARGRGKQKPEAPPLKEPRNAPTRLTARQREIVILIGRGHSDKEIADQIKLSTWGVQRHIQDACIRSGMITGRHVSGRVQLVMLAIAFGWIDFDQEIRPGLMEVTSA